MLTVNAAVDRLHDKPGSIILGFQGNHHFACGYDKSATDIYAKQLIEAIEKQILNIKHNNKPIPYFFLCATGEMEKNALEKYLKEKILTHYVGIVYNSTLNVTSRLLAAKQNNNASNSIGKVVGHNAGDPRKLGGLGPHSRYQSLEEALWLITTLQQAAGYDFNEAIYKNLNYYSFIENVQIKSSKLIMHHNEEKSVTNIDDDYLHFDSDHKIRNRISEDKNKADHEHRYERGGLNRSKLKRSSGSFCQPWIGYIVSALFIVLGISGTITFLLMLKRPLSWSDLKPNFYFGQWNNSVYMTLGYASFALLLIGLLITGLTCCKSAQENDGLDRSQQLLHR